MALGVPGTGPYGRIRALQTEIGSLKYELVLIDQGIKKMGREKIKARIAEKREEIKKINKNLKGFGSA